VIVAAQAEKIGSQPQTPPAKGVFKMKGHTFLSRIVEFFRAEYPANAPQLGHVALIAMCPAAAGVALPSANT
jgi:hypothetical protein